MFFLNELCEQLMSPSSTVNLPSTVSHSSHFSTHRTDEGSAAIVQPFHCLWNFSSHATFLKTGFLEMDCCSEFKRDKAADCPVTVMLHFLQHSPFGKLFKHRSLVDVSMVEITVCIRVGKMSTVLEV